MLDEQPRSGGGRERPRAGGVRRHRQRGAQLGLLRRDRRDAAPARERSRRCWSSPASPWACSAPTRRRRACCSPTRTSCGKWATWEHFRELDRKGLMMYGQMTAGSWIYIGSQGIVQGTYETLRRRRRATHFRGTDLAGKIAPHRRPRRHGRRAAAGRHHGRRRRSSAWRSIRAASSGGSRPATSTTLAADARRSAAAAPRRCEEPKPRRPLGLPDRQRRRGLRRAHARSAASRPTW